AVTILSASGHPLYDRPGLLGDRPGALAGLDRMLAGSGAVLHAAHDPLQDRRDTEHVVRHVELEVRNAVASGATAIGVDVFLFGRDAETGIVDAGKAAEDLRRQSPRHQVIREIAQRMA